MSDSERAELRRNLVQRDRKSIWHPYTQMSEYQATAEPLVIERAAGSRLYDYDGRSIIDGNASWWTSLLGHNHPRLLRALHEQSERLCHTSLAGVTHEPVIGFTEELLAVAPPGIEHVFFSDNGSTAVESALKMAIQYFYQSPAGKKKQRFISLADAFHGETMGVTALNGVEAFVRPFLEHVMPVEKLPSPADGEERSLQVLSQLLAIRSDEFAALVIEPLIQGAGGMRFYGPEFLSEAARLCQRHDVLLIVDEVFTGYGRTGSFWAIDSADCKADIVCSAKGLSGGMLPFAATLTNEKVFSGFLGEKSRAFMYGHTYCGNPLGAAIAREVLAVYRDEKILEGVQLRAAMIQECFARLAKVEGVKDARARGMCAALNLGEGSDYLRPLGWKVYEAALARGSYLRPLGNVVYMVPPLNIPLSDLAELLQTLEEVVMNVLKESNPSS